MLGLIIFNQRLRVKPRSRLQRFGLASQVSALRDGEVEITQFSRQLWLTRFRFPSPKSNLTLCRRGTLYLVCSAAGVFSFISPMWVLCGRKVLLGLLSIWNVCFLHTLQEPFYPILKPWRSLCLIFNSMESNGKGVSIDGVALPYESGEIYFGEPGTKGQHSFYQFTRGELFLVILLVDVVMSQQPVYLKGEVVSNHDELMSFTFLHSRMP